MINRISLITLGVKDVAKSRDFYKGLGFEITSDSPNMVDFKIENINFSIFKISMLAEDVNIDNPPEITNGFTGMALAHNTDSKEAVDELYLKVLELGGSVEFAPRKAALWNGYHFYFRDLDGHYWEIAH